MRREKELTLLLLKYANLNSIYITIFFFILLQLYMMFVPEHGFTLQNVIFLTIVVGMISFGCGIYFGCKSSSLIKTQFSIILQYLSTVRRGNFSEQISEKKAGVLGDEINELSRMLGEQVSTIQRLANEKAELHEKVHSAAVLEERQRLARELHDSVSQQLFALSMMASASLKIMDKNPNDAKKQIEQIADIAAKAQGEMRALLLHLRPIDLSGESLSEGVLSLLKELKAKTNLVFDASIDEIEGLPKSVEEHLFRIIQEGLSNILRHADADQIKVELTEKYQQVYLYLSDNGKGFDTTGSKKMSYGLKNMRERCEEIGGIFTLRSQKGKGTYIVIRVTINKSEQ